MRQHYPLNSNGVEDAGQLPWLDGVPSTGTQGSYPGHAIVTDTEAEVLAAIDASGQSRNGNDLAQLIQAIARGIYIGQSALLTALGLLATDQDVMATNAKLEAIRLLLVSPTIASGAATDTSVLAITTKLEALRLLLATPALATGAASAANQATEITALQALVTAAQDTTPTNVAGTVTANLGALNGAATETTLQAIKAALLAQVDFESSIVTDGTSFYVRREAMNEGTGAITVSFTDMAGNAASPGVANLVPAASSNTRVVETALFDVTTSGTGTSVGDVVARVIVYDTRTNAIAAAYWHNLTTGAALASAPSAGAIVEQARNLAAGAATSALQTAGNTSLASIVTALAALLSVDTVVRGTATDRSGTIAAGGTAQQLMAANPSRRGWKIQNLSSGDLWFNGLGTAAASQPSERLPAGAWYETPAHHCGTGTISIFGSTTGQAFSAREF